MSFLENILINQFTICTSCKKCPRILKPFFLKSTTSGFCTKPTTDDLPVLRKKCCYILGLEETYTREELKERFLQLAKKFHPDSKSKNANVNKFLEVESAYQTLKNLDTSNNSIFDDVYQTLEKDYGIKHTVPQHRQYLSFEGVGSGTPGQRQRQYENVRVNQAMQNVYDHRIKKARADSENQLIFRDAALAREFKTRQAMERLVEDLIQASMARGEFDNLPGSGKPLKMQPENPYVDSTTHKLNQILINNGFTPEWIVLEKEIREEREHLRSELRKRRAHVSPPPVSQKEQLLWLGKMKDLQELTQRLNARIDKFNMIVPILQKQQFRFVLESEGTKILKETPQQLPVNIIEPKTKNEMEHKSLLATIFNYIK